MHPALMTVPALEAALAGLYAHEELEEATRKHRAELARTYHDLTGAYYAARYYVAGAPPKHH
jgi:hypothetical protein